MPPDKPKPDKPTSRRVISNQLRAIIRARGESAGELSRASGVDRGMILRFLAEQRDIKLDTLDRLADVLGLRLIEGAVGKARPARAKPPRAPRPASPVERIDGRPADGESRHHPGGASATNHAREDRPIPVEGQE